jgi:two-component system sensor histidine kinase CpxA
VRGLFPKILAWFILTVIVAVSGTAYVSNELSKRQPRDPRFRGFRFELQEARDAWQNNGQEGLERVLTRIETADSPTQMREGDRVEAHLADVTHKDLLNGYDWSKEIAAMQASNPGRGNDNPFFLFTRVEGPRPQQMVVESQTVPKYYLIIRFPPNPAQAGTRIELLPQTWWMLGIFAILCYVLALHVTSPLREMQKTVERFGQGDFTARVNSRRADELGQLGRTVDRMAERIDNLLKAQRRLLQDISHELRSPLARLGVAVELARGGGDMETSLNRIEREGTRLNSLVGELIQVTRGEGDPQGLTTEQIRLDELVQTIVDDSRIEAEKRHVDLNSSVTEVTMTGNPELLRRAVENLVRNAIRYSPENTTVDVSLSKVGSVYRISVRDHGSGVPEESLSSIFDPFYRVEKDRGRTSGGVGLGLAIAKRAVELHRGTMRAQNVKPGLRVEIDLPVPAALVEEPTLAGARA